MSLVLLIPLVSVYTTLLVHGAHLDEMGILF